ncbi:cupin domain-containing protein [Oceanibacterium hippocampi]|uniref:Cupin domain protein n=1 Tax=Oceanibacterium hippocampi TaxID=745714 RepID=A0A1Y5TC05_9PROT|nr:cupin domain-containing protein [Oceanibacterium hippocampi]SLN60331.1 Cupin domain protein [Oceanibacterium hippocampi]
MATNRQKAVATIQVDNARTRVALWEFARGAETGHHVHGFDYVVVPLGDGELTIVDDNGKETRVPMRAGASYFREAGVSHNVINSGAAPFAFVETEFK